MTSWGTLAMVGKTWKCVGTERCKSLAPKSECRTFVVAIWNTKEEAKSEYLRRSYLKNKQTKKHSPNKQAFLSLSLTQERGTKDQNVCPIYYHQKLVPLFHTEWLKLTITLPTSTKSVFVRVWKTQWIREGIYFTYLRQNHAQTCEMGRINNDIYLTNHHQKPAMSH